MTNIKLLLINRYTHHLRTFQTNVPHCWFCTCLEYRVSWVRVPPEAAHLTALGVLCCFALFVCLTLLSSFFLPSHLSLKHVYFMARTPPKS